MVRKSLFSRVHWDIHTEQCAIYTANVKFLRFVILGGAQVA